MTQDGKLAVLAKSDQQATHDTFQIPATAVQSVPDETMVQTGTVDGMMS